MLDGDIGFDFWVYYYNNLPPGETNCLANYYLEAPRNRPLLLLDLSFNRLRGRLPPYVPPNLMVLSLEGNWGLVGDIPEAFSLISLSLNLTMTSVQSSTSRYPSFMRFNFGLRSSVPHRRMSCPTLRGTGNQAYGLPTGYDQYSSCSCDDGYEGRKGSCIACKCRCSVRPAAVFATLHYYY